MTTFSPPEYVNSAELQVQALSAEMWRREGTEELGP